MPDSRTTETFRAINAISPLPTGTPWTVRLSYYAIRFLAFHNRLDGLMSFVGIWWAGWTLCFPEFWDKWPVAEQVSRVTGGHPSLVAFGLLLASLIGYWAKIRRIDWLRTMAFLLAFACWTSLTLIFLYVRPIFSPSVACYSAFALAKLLAYVNFQIGLDLPDHRNCRGD